MSWRSAFEAQWSIFLAVVEAKLRREIVARGHVSAAGANAILAADVATWTRGGHYNAAWLGTLARQSPELGASFRRALEEVRLTRDVVPSVALPLGAVATAVASSLGAAGVLAWQQAGLAQILLVVGAILLAASPVVVALWAAAREQAISTALDEVRAALAPAGQALRAVAAEVDRPASAVARERARARSLVPESPLACSDGPALVEPLHLSLVQIGTPLRGLGSEMRGAALHPRVYVA